MRVGSGYACSMLYDAYRGQGGARTGQLPPQTDAENRRATGSDAEKIRLPGSGGESDAALQEQNVLARERALRAVAAGGAVNTTYTYATGTDGQRYIAGADVSVTAPEEVLDAIAAGMPFTKTSGKADAAADEHAAEADAKADDTKPTGEGQKSDPGMAAEVAQLEQTERDVIAHEAAHKAVGGQYASAATYSYTTGPDGKRYISGGEVSIRTPATDDPEQALRMAEQVRRAALAPANPSGQDISVAASAAQTAANARAEMARATREAVMTAREGTDRQDRTTGGERPGGVSGSAPASDSGGETDIAASSGVSAAQSRRAVDAYASISDINKPKTADRQIYAIG